MRPAGPATAPWQGLETTVAILLALTNLTGNRSHQVQEFFRFSSVEPITGFLVATKRST